MNELQTRSSPLVWLSLPCKPQSSSEARHQVRRRVGPVLDDEQLANAELAVSELVSNAVRTGRRSFVLQVDIPRASTLRISVSDADSHLPVRKQASAQATSGRGLAIIDALANTWGWRPRRPAGKTVWCELRVDGLAPPP